MSPEKFGAYIRNLRKEKKLTTRQLEEKSGVSNAYISQIENGKRAIPTPEILMKIHGPLGVGYDELMEKAGYISPSARAELLPETINTIESYNALNELISNAADIFIVSVSDGNGDLKDGYKQFLKEKARELYPNISIDELNLVIDDPKILTRLFENLTTEEKIIFLNSIIKDFVDRDIDPKEVFKRKSQILSETFAPVSSTIKVPVLGYIAAGQPILADDNIEEWIEIPNLWKLKEGEVIVLEVKGDSMVGSRIYEGDRVVVKLQSDVENGEIAVVNVNGDEATLKRVKKTTNGQVILYPDNPKYDPIFIESENSRIIGKVIQVMFEPK